MEQILKKFVSQIFQNSETRITWLKRIALIGLWLGILLSVPLWVGKRDFPRVPVVSHIPNILEYFLFALLLFFSASAFVANKNISNYGVVATLIIFCVLDATRTQPWVFYYAAILLVLSIPNKKNDRSDKILRSLQILFAGIYFWSGVQKMNLTFLLIINPWILGSIVKLFPSFSDLIMLLGLLVPVIESGMGVALLFKRTSRYASLALIAMHVVILFALGPVGYNSNSVVWPWNIAMAVSLYLLFSRTVPDNRTSKLYWPVIVLFWIAPLGSFFNIWPLYFSGALYSGNVPTARIEFRDNNNYIFKSINEVSYKELNVPAIPSVWYYNRVLDEVCLKSPLKNDFLLINYRPGLRSTEGTASRRSCDGQEVITPKQF